MERKTVLKATTLCLLFASAIPGHAQDYVDNTTSPPSGGGAGGEQAVHDAKSYQEQQAQTAVLQQQLADMAKQLDELKQQTGEVKKTNDAVTGSSGKGDIQTQDYGDSIPRNWKETLDAYKGGGRVEQLATDIGNKLNDDEKELDGKSSKDAAMYSLEEGVKRSTNGSALNAQAYESSVARIEKLKQLQAQIDKTSSLKEVADLQARIQIENSMITNELVRTQSFNGMLMDTEYAKAYQSVKDMDMDDDKEGNSD
ncbi:type IV secretion system protein [Dyella sp. GSA-30]|uniref:type IV secretion system protein n=1 Tax=Dyella sp. GSA-30 TaxID=2994496 RepID=UPI0024919A33|nr:type IV secretion system protein [Dyella sp. GSA-30]BDU18564.1 hypothetical protein DYGSA30_00210 [Dyella sp. GSA-30]